ncbi:translocation/assembly module TamB domain-containing protein [Iodidimonas sp. SYSU 1G8]|uniref:translocation/assembly module TamB domain-containing protein n=1 Tax=Iodidimonas sp. SYSU 1G8 TaxID=3133967 RepID=UPI0031FE9391
MTQDMEQTSRPWWTLKRAWTPALVVGIVLMLYVLLRAGAFNGLIAGIAEDAIGDPATQSVAVITDLSGDPLSDLTIGRFTLTQQGKTVVMAERVAVRWRHLGLLAGTVHVESLSAARLTLAQAPPTETTEPLALPNLPVDLRLDRLKVDEVLFEGEETPFTLMGALRWTRSPAIEIRLALAPQDARGESIRLVADYEPARDRLALDGKLVSKAGGGLGGFLFPGEDGDIEMTLGGQGSVNNWRGRLDGTRSGKTIADLTILFTDRLRIAGVMDPRPFLPKNETTALIGAPAVTIDIAFEDGLPESYGATLINPGAEIRLEGTLTGGDEMMSPRFSLRSRNAEWFAALLGDWRYGTLAADGSVTRDGARTSMAATVTLDRLSGPDLTARQVSGEIVATAGDGETYGIEGKGALEDVATSGQTLRADWAVNATYDTAAGRIAIAEASLSDAGSSLTASGDVVLSPLSVKGEARIALNDLRRVPALGAAGRLNASANVDWRPDAGRLLVKATGEAAALALQDARLSALIGASPRFSLTLDDPAGAGQGDLNGTIKGARVTAGINGRIGDTIDATYEARFADVADLAGDAVTASGPLAVTGTITGETASPDVTMRTGIAAATVSGLNLTDVSLSAAFRDVVAAPEGRLDANFGLNGEPIQVAVPFAMGEDGAWRADPIAVTGQSLSLSGALAADSLASPMSGTLELRVAGKDVPTALAGMPASGNFDGTVAFAPEGDAQRIRIDMSARDAALSPSGENEITMAQARLQGDLLAGEALDIRTLSLKGTDIVWDRAKLDQVAATVTPSGTGLALNATITGDYDGPLSVTLEGRADRPVLAAPNTITLEALNGTIVGQKVTLSSPATVVLAEAGTEVGPIRLSYNGSPVEAQASIREQGGTARLRASDLDVAALSKMLGGVDMTGKLSLDGRIDLSGAPQGTFSLRVDDLLVADSLDRRPVTIAANGRLGGSRASGTLTIDTGGQRALEATAEVPVSRGDGPFALTVNENAPLQAAVKGNAELAYIWPLTGAYEHILGGTARVDATVSGSIAAPTLNGQFGITNMTYRNLSTGFRAQTPEMRFVLRDNLLEIPSTAASDGGKGVITLSGWIKPLAPGGMEADLNAAFDRARVLKLRDMTARATGKIRYVQTAEYAEITGDARVNEAEYTLNARASDDVIKLYVVELNRPPGLITLPEKPAETPFKTRLRINVSAENRLFVRGRGLDSEWQGQVRVRGTTDNLALQGRIELVKGEFDFAGRTFVLQDGSRIELVGGGDLDPVINARAVYTVPSLSAEIALSGRASNPQIKLSSNPEMPQDEIISRVLFGTGKANLSTFEAAQLATAVASLGSSGSGFDVIGKLRGALSLDRLTVGTLDRPGADDEDEAGSPVIRGGKYITKDIYVEFGSATEEEDATSASVEIDLTKNLSVGTEATSTGNQKFRVQYKLDY